MKNQKDFIEKGDSEKFLRTVVRESLDGIMVIDAEGVVRFANPAAEKIFRPLTEELEEYSIGVPSVDESLEMIVPDGGQERTVEMRAANITWHGEEAYLAVVRDISKRIMVEDELRKRERLLRETNEMARVGGWALDVDTQEVWWSGVTRQIHEVPPDYQPHLDDALKFFPLPEGEKLADAIVHTRETGEPYDLELPFVTEKGNHLWVRTIGKAEFKDGKVVRLRGTFQDITERKQAEIELRKSERQFRQLFEHDINGFMLIEARPNDSGENQKFIFQEVNQAFEEILGLVREEVIGHSVDDVLPSLRESNLPNIILEVFKTGNSKQFEYYSDTFEKHFHFSAYKPLPGQIALIFNDITDRKSAQEELRQSEKKYRTLYQTMAQGVVYTDAAGNYTSANPAAEEILGMGLQELKSRSCTDPKWETVKKTGEPLPAAEHPMVIALEKGERVEDVIYGVKNPQREKRVWLNVSAVPLFREGEDDPYQVFTTFLDISDLIEVQEELRKSERKFRTLYQTMAQGVVYQNANGEITSANPAAERILGLSHDQLLGKESIDEDWQAIKLNGEPLPGEKHPGMVALRTGERVEDFEFGVNNPKRGETVWINVSAVPQFQEGEENPCQVFTTFLDITDRVRIQKVLEERVKELRCISNISAFIEKDPTINDLCRITVEELVQAMQFPDISKAVVELAGEHYEEDGFEDGTENSLQVPIRLRDDMIGRIRVCYIEDKEFLIPEEKNLLENISRRLSSYYKRQQTQQALEESEERFRRAVMDAPNPLAIYAEDGEVVTVNTAWTEFSGYEAVDIPTVSDWLEKAHGEESEILEKEIKELFMEDEPVENGEYKVKTKDGDDRIWFFRSSPLGRLPDGRRAVISMATDITERVEAEEKLEASEERFRTAIFEAPYPIMIHAQDGEVLTVNDAWIEGSGYSAEELQTLENWTDKAFRERGEEVISMIREKYAERRQLDEEEMVILTKDGERRIWQFTSAALGTTPDGRFSAMTIARDITEREKYLDRIVALREIDQVVSSTLDLDEVLNLITEEMQHVMHYDMMSILLKQGQRLQVFALKGVGKIDNRDALQIPITPDYPNYDVVNQKQPLALTDVAAQYPKFSQALDLDFLKKIKSWLGVPFISKGEVIGMFAMDRYESDPFTEEDIEVARQFASRAAIAIDNAQLYEKTIRQLEQLEILRDIDSLITRSLALDEALPELLHYVRKGLDVDAATVLIYDDESEHLILKAGEGLQHELQVENPIELGQGYAGKVAASKSGVFVPEVVYGEGGEVFPVNLEQEGMVSFYGLPLITKGDLKGVLELFHRNRLDPDQEWMDFAETLSGQAAIAVDNITLFNGMQQANEDLRQSYNATTEGWAKALELRDQETEGHSQRMVELTLEMAKRFGFKEEELQHIRRGVLLHDIGKMGIPDAILHKPGPLTEAEWEIMRKHPVFSFNMLKDIDYLKPALKIPHYHHERWDGSGYPEGLKGKEIPLEARIFMVVDIWDALLSDRPYRDAWSEEKTMEYLQDQAGKTLDPEIVAVFLEFIQETGRAGAR